MLNYGAQSGLTHVASAPALISWLSASQCFHFNVLMPNSPKMGLVLVVVCYEGLCCRLCMATG